MNKFGNLLDEITVVSFPMLWKLINRYRRMCIAVVVSVVILSGVFYALQSNVFSSSISFKNNVVENGNESKRLFMISDNEVKKAEILRLESSVDFYRLVASNLLSKFSLKEVIVGIQEKGDVVLKKILMTCSSKVECQTELLANMLPRMLDISYGDRNGNHYVLTVRTVTPIFNRQLLDVVIKSIQSSRVDAKKGQLVEQQTIAKRMIESNRAKLENTKYLELKEEISIYNTQLSEFNEKMKVFHKNFLGQQQKMNAAQARLNHRKTSLGREVNANELEISKRRVSLKKKIAQLSSDISAIELLSDNKSGESLRILRELKRELASNRKVLKKMPHNKRELNNLDRFISNNDQKYDASVFDYNVFKDQVALGKVKYNQMQLQKKELINKKLNLERKLGQIEPAAKLLHDLETRLIELQLMESTAVSDLGFDRFATTVKQMRKTPIFLLAIYCMTMILISLLGGIITRYLMDHKIYDEDDLKMSLKNIKILGSIPEFE